VSKIDDTSHSFLRVIRIITKKNIKNCLAKQYRENFDELLKNCGLTSICQPALASKEQAQEYSGGLIFRLNEQQFDMYSGSDLTDNHTSLSSGQMAPVLKSESTGNLSRSNLSVPHRDQLQKKVEKEKKSFFSSIFGGNKVEKRVAEPVAHNSNGVMHSSEVAIDSSSNNSIDNGAISNASHTSISDLGGERQTTSTNIKPHSFLNLLEILLSLGAYITDAPPAFMKLLNNKLCSSDILTNNINNKASYSIKPILEINPFNVCHWLRALSNQSRLDQSSSHEYNKLLSTNLTTDNYNLLFSYIAHNGPDAERGFGTSSIYSKA
jgi:hypothetical protein